MIGLIGDAAADAALAACVKTGVAQADCQAQVNDRLVNGVYCDGEISLSLDANGNKVQTCTPLSVVQQKLNVQAASLGTQYDPLPPPAPATSSTTVIAVGVGLAVVVGWFVLRGR